MQAQQVQQADMTFTGIVQNTVGLGDVLKAELPEIAQFEKVSVYENNISRKWTHIPKQRTFQYLKLSQINGMQIILRKKVSEK